MIISKEDMNMSKYIIEFDQRYENKSAKWHCGRHTLICKKILVKKT